MATKRKTKTNKALEEAAEIAPFIQEDQSDSAAQVSATDAKKAIQFIMESVNNRKEETVVVDGVQIPSEAELLSMSEDDYMNEKQVAFFKHLLKVREEQLRSNAESTTEHLRENSIVPDPADRATIEEEHALELRTRDRERKLLKKVQEALKRLEKGEYGWCEETGEPIGIPRLLARPTATLSLEAQQRRELKQKLYGD
jgi:DnaK suppressor protein